MHLRVDPEFKNFFGPLDEDTRLALESSIRAEGCRDALVIWRQPDGDPILLDGHNRHEICERMGIDYRAIDCPATVADRSGAIAWIMENQRARRNIEPLRIAYLRGQLYLNEKLAHGGQGGNRFTVQSDHRDHSVEAKGKTAERLAEKLKVSAPTIRRNAEFASQVNAVAADHGPEALEEIVSGRKKVSDYIPNPEPEPPVKEEAPLAPAPEPEPAPTPVAPVPASASASPPAGEQPSAGALPEGDPLHGWSKQTESDHVQWMAKNLTPTSDGGLRPGAVHFSDTVSENLVDPEHAKRFANSYMNHLCQLEHHAAMLPSAVENDDLDAERLEKLKTRLARLVDALQTFNTSL